MSASAGGAPVQVGDVLAGKYLVERVLGVGGMGVVVAARHMHLDEHVAIKFLLPEASKSPALVARFSREARAAVKIRSEHVARVIDVGTLDSGSPFIVMEYLEGTDLGALVKEWGPLPIDAAVDHILQACEAIAEAHVHGIIHRDLKPSNLFLTTRADGSPSIKVIDFGISKLAERPIGEMEITGTLEARGSPLFMSPEQMVSARDVDARSDIWSIGIALHHLMTGEYPFQAPTMPQICGLVLTAEPIRLTDVIADAPLELEAVLLRCLEKDPAKRFQNVGELAQALEPFGSQAGHLSVDRVSRIMKGAGFAMAAPDDIARRASAADVPPRRPSSPGIAVRRSSSPNLAAVRPAPPPASPDVVPSAASITAGPVVHADVSHAAPPPPKMGQLVLAASIAALIIMAVTVGVVLFVLSRGPGASPPSGASGPLPSASPALAPLPSTAAPPRSAAPASSPSTVVAAEPSAAVSASSAKPWPASGPAPTYTSKPQSTTTAPRPKPSDDLFNTPK